LLCFACEFTPSLTWWDLLRYCTIPPVVSKATKELTTRGRNRRYPFCRNKSPHTMSSTAIGIKKKDRCLSRKFAADENHCSLRTPVDNNANRLIMPKTLPGIGKCKTFTVHVLRK